MEDTTVFWFEKFLEIEDKYDLFDMEINHIRIWQYIRFSYCAKLLEELTGIRTTNRNEKVLQSKSVTGCGKEWLKEHQFLVRKKTLLVVNHPRRVKEGNTYKCFVTDAFLENLKKSYYVYEDAYQGKHYSPAKTKGLKYRDINYIKSLYPYDKYAYEAEIREVANKITKVFEQELSVELRGTIKSELYNLILYSLENIFYGRKYAEIILNLIRPKAVIVTVYYKVYNQTLIETAKNRGIPTIELQHGRIGNSHAAYNFKQVRNLQTFPDYIFVYGQYEKQIPRFPVPKEHIYATGYPELEKKAEYYKKNHKQQDKKVITFISSPVEGGIISKYAIGLAKKMKEDNFEIVYKLHPSEYNNWKKYYPDFEAMGIQVVSSNQHDIYYYLGNSDYVVGISSTVLFEAMQFAVNIIIIKEQDYMKSEAIYENNCATLVSHVDELYEIINREIPVCSKDSNFYFEKDANKKMKKALDQCIKKGTYKNRKKNMGLLERCNTIIKLSSSSNQVTQANNEKNELAEKHLALYLLMNQWVRIKQDGKGIDEFFSTRKYNNIAIYGMNYVGETLFRELKGSNVQVKYAVDKNANNIAADLTVYKPTDKLESVDVIVVTPIYYFDQIEAELKKYISCPILSIKDILDSVDQQSNQI